MTITEKCEEVQRTARALFAQQPDWVTFYRQMFGLYGTVRRHYPTREALDSFQQTVTFLEIQQMVKKLREQGPVAVNEEEPTRVITVRLPKSMHESLRVEAHEHHTSMNKLCISKLLQFVDDGMIPKE